MWPKLMLFRKYQRLVLDNINAMQNVRVAGIIPRSDDRADKNSCLSPLDVHSWAERGNRTVK